MYRILLILLPLLLFSCSDGKVDANVSQGNWHYDKGEVFYGKNLDSAYFHFNKARAIYENAGDSRSTARALMYLAIIQTFKGDYFGSNETCIEALEFAGIAQKKNMDLLGSIYNQQAINYESLKDYVSAEKLYRVAMTSSKDNAHEFIFKTNIGMVKYKNGQYKDAVDVFRSFYSDPDLRKDSLQFARVLDGYAYSKFLSNRKYNAENELLNALKVFIKVGSLENQGQAHRHLFEFYREKNPGLALRHAYKAMAVANSLNSPDDLLQAYKNIIMLEQPENLKIYFKKYYTLNDSIQRQRAAARNQFALIRYETDQQKMENVRKQNQILKLYFGLSLMFLALVYGVFQYRRRRKIMEQQKELELKNTRLKYSKKVHDVVANGLYQTMLEVERQETPDKVKVLEALEKMYEESRDISHENFDKDHQGFALKISQMLSSYSSPGQKVMVVANSEALWDETNENVREEVFLSLRELMTNMKKHSGATLVTVKFEKFDDQMFIKYTDNGTGIDVNNKQSSGGLKNTENRIVGVGGKINFGKNEKGGLTVAISIPLVHNV